MVNPSNDMAQMATARANMYGLLADVYREEPSEAFLSNLRDPEFSGTLKALDIPLDDMLDNSPSQQLAEDLAVEYTRIFIGPGPRISPHESLHVEARYGEENGLWGRPTVAVKKFMEAAGLEVDDKFDGMPDHITVEFEFMQRLLEKEAEAWSKQDLELATNILNIEMKFYDEHLSLWILSFCDKIIENADHAFYKQFAEVTKDFIVFENDTLQDLIDRCAGDKQLSA